MKEPFLKRPFDFLLSLTGIILSSPLWILIGLLIIIEDGLPIFYGQERVGKNGRIFSALKFRPTIKEEISLLRKSEISSFYSLLSYIKWTF
jgi:lipopolysaccharide/colanic/teichoic acid biosynthesis glycosyltransferase